MSIRTCASVALAAAAFATTAHADSLNHVFVNGTTNTTTALTGFSTTGSMMNGMKVTAFFADATSQPATWGTTGADAGGAFGTGWSLIESGDTFGGAWTLSNDSGKAITKVLIDAGPGDTVFDIDWGVNGGEEGTVGSALGLRLGNVVNGNGLDIVATYTDRVAVSPNAPVGDLWRFLEIAFDNAGGYGSGRIDTRALSFWQDTDNLKFSGDLATPLPTAAAMGLSMLGLAGLRRRR